MKHIRLEKAVGKITFEQLLQLYKEVKKTRDIHKILLFKSFITRMMDAQWEYDEDGMKRWATIDQYTSQVIMNKNSYPCGVATPLKFILHVCEYEAAYGYKLKRDLRKTL